MDPAGVSGILREVERFLGLKMEIKTKKGLLFTEERTQVVINAADLIGHLKKV